MSKDKTMLPRKITVLLLCAAVMVASQHARAAEPLFVGTARVDIMGENASDARALGMAEAKRNALDGLFRKFVPEHRATLMDNLNDKRIDKLVRNVEITNESIDGNRFRAEIRVSYSAPMFNTLISQKIEAVESDQQLLTTASLILPIFEAADRTYLFESVNPWAKAWANVARNIGRGQLVTPFGDSVDYSMMAAEKAEEADFKDFSPLRRRYGVRDVIILQAKFLTKQSEVAPAEEKTQEKVFNIFGEEEEDEAAKKRKQNLILHIRERRVQAKEDEIKTIEFMMDSAEDKDKLMERAARDLGIYIMTLQGQTADKVAEATKEYNTILMVTPVTTMKRFAWIKERISRVPGVERLEVLALKPEQADMQIYYTGEREILLQSMEDTGLKFKDSNQYLEIRL